MRIVTLILVSLSACLIATADESACTTRDFRGVFAFRAQATNVTNNSLITFAGSLTADGDGKITAWKDQAAIPATPPVPPNFKVVSEVLDRYEQAKSLGGEIQHTVERDCRIGISATFLGPTGAPSPLVWTGALASGGKQALVMNASAQSPYLSLVTVKRAAHKDRAENKYRSRAASIVVASAGKSASALCRSCVSLARFYSVERWTFLGTAQMSYLMDCAT